MAPAFHRNRFPYDLLLGFVLLLLMVGGSFLFARQQAADSAESVRLVELERTMIAVLSAAKDAETGQRGYLLTHSDVYLLPYQDGRARAGPALEQLARSDDPGGRAAGRRLRPLVDAKLAELAETIAAERAGDHARALAIVQTNRGRALMDRIRLEQQAARQRTQAHFDMIARRSLANARWLIAGLVVGLLGVVGVAAIALRQYRGQIAEVGEERDRAASAYASLMVESNAREVAEEQLRQVQKMEAVGQLTGGIAHDFNNMLAIVIGSLDMASRRIGDTSGKLERSIATAREGAERAAALTGRLLSFSRQQPLAPIPIDVNRLVAGMSELLRRTLGEQVAVETVLAGGLWPTFADPGQLENALLNLAVNARDAILGEDGADGRLTIETSNAHLDEAYAASRSEVRAGQYVMVGVSDTGSGMSAEIIARAFDPFFTTKAVGRGTGLGLSQVFGFAKQSSGHVAIYSEVGEGTTVKLYLPRASGKVEMPAPTLAPDELPVGRADEIILVVEDEQRVRHFSVDALRELGYTAISAPNGAEALKILDEQPQIALLFTDIVMPEMNGRALSDLARAKRPDLRVLYTTGYTRNAVVHNGMLDAGVAFLPKPFTVAQLAVKVRDVLDGGGINRPA